MLKSLSLTKMTLKMDTTVQESKQVIHKVSETFWVICLTHKSFSLRGAHWPSYVCTGDMLPWPKRTNQWVWDGLLNREDTNLGTVQEPEAFCLPSVQKNWESQSREGKWSRCREAQRDPRDRDSPVPVPKAAPGSLRGPNAVQSILLCA